MRTAAMVTAGRWARLLLLVGTLLGLAAMHTIGHDAHPAGHGAGASTHAAASVAQVGAEAGQHPGAGGGHDPVALRHDVAGLVAYAAATLLPAVAGCPGDCPHDRLIPAGGGGGGGLPGWGVCLAVLGAFAASLLLTLLLLAGVRVLDLTGRRSGGASRSSRAPPPRPLGLRLATVAVLRR
ncbi:hypothetical protein NCC78_13740 [Micromonospora phytophila]|uniref:hypothetical protein n=1 Tax=Micromonospora phytophila TaxID=709888 RepID=UPI00202F2A4C|nr:hypothetical protein [Micromonospora phytophila]MCM0675743.1 hypothetical protein [Micromonospora phytophila]